MTTQKNPAETSRRKIIGKIKKKGYSVSKAVAVGESHQYWIIYTTDKENKERICINAEWSLT